MHAEALSSFKNIFKISNTSHFIKFNFVIGNSTNSLHTHFVLPLKYNSSFTLISRKFIRALNPFKKYF